MNKSDLIDILSDETGLDKKNSELIIKSILKSISKSIINGDTVKLIGFGSFSISKRSSRNCRNIKTGKIFLTKDIRLVRFKPSKELNDKINS